MDRSVLIEFARILEEMGCRYGWPVSVSIGNEFGERLISAMREAAVKDMERHQCNSAHTSST